MATQEGRGVAFILVWALCSGGCSCSRDVEVDQPSTAQKRPSSDTDKTPAKPAQPESVASAKAATTAEAECCDGGSGGAEKNKGAGAAGSSGQQGSGGQPRPETSAGRRQRTPSGKAGEPPVELAGSKPAGIPADPRRAAQDAQRMLNQAEQAAAARDYGKAFERSVRGWQTAQWHARSDDACAALARTLLARMEQYGERATQDRQTSQETRGKTLQVK